jgi:hypothetical protein
MNILILPFLRLHDLISIPFFLLTISNFSIPSLQRETRLHTQIKRKWTAEIYVILPNLAANSYIINYKEENPSSEVAVAQLANKLSKFYEPPKLVTMSQESDIRPYPKPVKPWPHSHTLRAEIWSRVFRKRSGSATHSTTTIRFYNMFLTQTA